MFKPLVSIVVPCFNYGHFLPETLDAIISQTWEAWECIVVDDGSIDNTGAVAGAYIRKDPRIRYLYQTNAGLSAARNTGLGASEGQYIQFLDADDAIAPQKLSKQVEYLEAHREADLVYGNALYFSDRIDQLRGTRNDSTPDAERRVSACGEALKTLLLTENIMEVSCPLVRRSLVERVGLFDTSYKAFEDWQYWFRCAVADACFHYWPEQGTETYIRHGHASMMRQLLRMNEAGIRIRRFMLPRLRGSEAWYNRYRLLKLGLKKIWLSLQR